MAPGSQTDLRGQVHDIDTFQNTLPTLDTALPQLDSEKHAPLTRPSPYDADDASDASLPRPDTRLKTLFLPALMITVPIALLSATLLALVFGYRTRSEPSIFTDGRDSSQENRLYVLVNFSATRLVFAASFLSTVAPLLATFIMLLYSVIVSASMRQASSHQQFERLPTPYQLSMLVGLCLASVQQIRQYITYVSSRKRHTRIPPVLKKAAGMFILCIFLATGVFVSDTALHYYTSTIEFDQISQSVQATSQSGYGMDKLCLDLDRATENYGYPCSLPVADIDPDWITRGNGVHRLQSNSSSTSQLRLTGIPNLDSNIALMIPAPATISSGHDFRTSTIGVGTQCKLIPPSTCNMHATGDSNPENEGLYTKFNCTDAFFGALGMPPNISSVSGVKSIDPNLPPLGWKYAPNMQTGFFTTPDLTQVYNPEGWNISTDQPSTINIAPDSALLNPLPVAFALRSSLSAFPPTSTINTTEPNVFHSPYGDYLDFLISCSITSYAIDYTWLHSSITNVTATPHTNGSFLEIYHGSLDYNTISGGGADLQMNLADAGITGVTTSDFLNTWGELYSVKVLAQIGTFLTPRGNIAEQNRKSLLVARVPTPALASLIACSLVYTVLGVALAVTAWRKGGEETQKVAEQLSLSGLTEMAFGGAGGEKTGGVGSVESGAYSGFGVGSRSATLTPGSALSRKGTDMSAPLGREGDQDYFTRLPSARWTSNRAQREGRRVRISGSDFRVWM